MAHKYVPHTFRTGEVIEPTRVNENARRLANEFNGNLDRENLRENSIESSFIVQQSCNLIGSRTSVMRSRTDVFGDLTRTSGVRQMSFRTLMTQDFQIKHDSLCIASYGFPFFWVDLAQDCDNYSALVAGNGGEVDLAVTPDRHLCIFTLRINGVEVCRSAEHTFIRKEDSVYLSGAHPVAAGTVTIDCQIKIVDKTTDHEFYIDSSGIDVLNFKFKKR